MDVLVAALGLVILSPLLLFVALAILVTMGRPVLYRQLRPGLHNKLFNLCKFRTMTDARDAAGELLPAGDRLTRLGVLLRKTSLDELPEFWNVLKGKMSLVGPRPLLREYLPYYTERERKRHSVRPGMTGLAQVSGRNVLDWDGRLELDAQYVERGALLLDMAILAKTVLKAIACSGVRVPGTVVKPLHWSREKGSCQRDEQAVKVDHDGDSSRIAHASATPSNMEPERCAKPRN